ncbi:DUF262 domain-containing protein [Candidatus Poribacteria bacterium]|nr:DUF262 domain-containing protein [Candidatus Poribacteria bacterium]
MSTFNIDRPLLSEILTDIGTGRIQLPDFQRDWIWDDYRIRSLLASVSQAFPIGAVLTLAVDGKKSLTRLVEGVNRANIVESSNTLILDGQQRLTALFQSLKSKRGAYTLNKKQERVTRYYYFDIEKCLSDEIDREKAVLSCRDNRRVRRASGEIIDLDSTEMEYEHSIFPVNKIFDSDDWGDEYKDYWQGDSSKRELFNTFNREVIGCFKQYNLPTIRLREDTPRKAVCLIFEKLNTRGVELKVFELLTVAFAIDNFQLREDWKKRSKRLKKYPVLGDLNRTHFLRTLTLLSTKANPKIATASCTRRSILQLTAEDYKKWADITEDGFIKAVEFLRKEKIFRAKDVPYQTQLTTLAAILADVNLAQEAIISEESHQLDESRKEELIKVVKTQVNKDQKISRWYWCGVFGEMYASAVVAQIANDFSEVISWLREETDSPSTIREATFQSDKLLEVQTRHSAVYKGAIAMCMRSGCLDFLTGSPIENKVSSDSNIDLHHIFPSDWCKRNGIESNDSESIFNKTVLSRTTNQSIGGQAPSKYLSKMKAANIDDAKVEKILTSHLISAEFLREDDFWGFFNTRKEALLKVIEKAMGKKVIRDGEDSPDTSAQ